MKMKNWMRYTAAAFICLAATSCSNDNGSSSEQKYVENFKALVMGGRDVDANQRWSTTGSISVTVAVDLGTDADYTVYILDTPPLFYGDATYLATARVHSGQSKTISVPKPANTGLLYAACYDSDGHALCQPFPAKASATAVTFSGKTPQQVADYEPTGTERWSVATQAQPDVTAYTSGTLVEAADQDSQPSDRYQVSRDFTGFIPAIATTAGSSVYVTGSWTLSVNQRVTTDAVIVVGDGGRIVIPEGMSLTTVSTDGGCGRIIVLPGGEISGQGAITCEPCTGTPLYNAGSIELPQLTLGGGTCYNAGAIGSSEYRRTTLTGDGESTSRLVNTGTVNIAGTEGEGLALQNAGYLYVSGELNLYQSAVLDNGSYTECQTLNLHGQADGQDIVYMGNAACLSCQNTLSVDNFGVWGPTGSGFTADAVLKFRTCTYCATTDGAPGTYLLDHVELVMTSEYPSILDNGAVNTWDNDAVAPGIGKLSPTFSGYYNLFLLYHWMNGYEGRLNSVDSYQWTADAGNHLNFLFTRSDGQAAQGVDADRQTCTYSTAPAYDHRYFSKASTVRIATSNCVYYAFEAPEGGTNDFDYNDVVLRVSAPADNGDGTFTSNVQVMCVGTTYDVTVLNGGEPFGDELHSVMGIASGQTINSSSASRVFSRLGELTTGDTPIDQLPLTLRVTNPDTNKSTLLQPSADLSTAPLFIVINGGTYGRWFWPTEGVNIGVAYPKLSTWGADIRQATDWYAPANAVSGKVVSWTSY